MLCLAALVGVVMIGQVLAALAAQALLAAMAIEAKAIQMVVTVYANTGGGGAERQHGQRGDGENTALVLAGLLIISFYTLSYWADLMANTKISELRLPSQRWLERMCFRLSMSAPVRPIRFR